MSGIEKFEHAQKRHILDLGVKKCFYENFINITFHEKTTSLSGDIKSFCPGRRMYMYTLPSIYGRMLSEEKASYKSLELMKRVGTFQVGIFRGGIFQEGSLVGGNF